MLQLMEQLEFTEKLTSEGWSEPFWGPTQITMLNIKYKDNLSYM